MKLGYVTHRKRNRIPSSEHKIKNSGKKFCDIRQKDASDKIRQFQTETRSIKIYQQIHIANLQCSLQGISEKHVSKINLKDLFDSNLKTWKILLTNIQNKNHLCSLW